MTRFIKYSAAEFPAVIQAFPWRVDGKSEIHVHHTWRPNHSQYRGAASIESMRNYHVNEKGWADIAQHVSIGPDGSIWTGRDWNNTPVSALGFNHAGVFMIETIGDFDHGKDNLEGDQYDALLTVVASLQDFFNLPLWWSVKFHNQMSGKTCPGSAISRSKFIIDVRDKLAELRRHVIPRNLENLSVDNVQPKIPPFANEAAGEVGHDAALEEYFANENQDAIDVTKLLMTTTSNETVKLDSKEPSNFYEIDDKAVAYLGPSRSVLEAVRALRSAEHFAASVSESTQTQYVSEDEALLVALGKAVQSPSTGGSGLPEMALGRDVNVAQTENINLFKLIGERVLRRVERQVYNLICGDSDEDKADRDKIMGALNISENAATLMITAWLASIGFAAAIAGLAGALILRRLVRPALEEGQTAICEIWGDKIDG